MEEKKEQRKTVSVEEFESLKEEIAKLRRGDLPIYDEDIKKEQFIDVRTWKVDDGKGNLIAKPIIGWDKEGRESIDDQKIVHYFVTLHLLEEDGKTEKCEIERKDYPTAGRLKSLVLDKRVKIRVEYTGNTTKKYVQDYRTVDTAVRVPLKVEIPEAYFKLRLPDGQEVEISEEYLN